MEEGSRTRCVPFVRIANIPRTTGRRAKMNWQTGRRCQILKVESRSANHVVRRALKDLANDGPLHPRALMSYGNSWLETILLLLISGKKKKNQSPGWLVSLVIGDYLAWFGEHLLGERFVFC